MVEDLHAEFEKNDGVFLKNKDIPGRPDLHAFNLLDKLLPGSKRDIVSSAGHDEIWLDIDCDELAKVATPEDIEVLARCGIRYSSSEDSLAMFV